MILSVIIIFGFSSSMTYIGDIVKNGFTQPNIGFQKANNFAHKRVDGENFGKNKSEIEPSIQITNTLEVIGTATIPPLPTYTLIFPETTVETELFQTNRQPIEKQTSPQYWRTVRRLWPILVLGIFWIILGLWFVFSQMIIK